MAESAEKKRVYGILGGFVCLLAAAAFFCIPKANGLCLLPDEFGYMARAAQLAGYDWREALTQCSWYSFGYGLFVFPLFRLISNPLLLYRTILGIHFCLLALDIFLVFAILQRLYPVMEGKRAAIISGSVMCYVAYLTYAHTGMTEILLVTLYLFLSWELLCWLEKGGWLLTVALAVGAGYLYMVHMRTIGICLALALIMILSALKDKDRVKIRKAVLAVLLFLVLFLAANLAKELLIAEAGSEEYRVATQVNDYGGQIQKVKSLLSLRGIALLAAGLAGKLFYLGCASFGLYYWGVIYLVKKIAGEWRASKKRKTSPRCCFYLWILLSHWAALLIAAVYTVDTNRLDMLMYGRYHENAIPLILAFGFIALLEKADLKRRLAALAAVQSLFFFALFSVIQTGKVPQLNTHAITGIIYAVDLAERYDNMTVLYAYLGGMAGSIVLMGLAWLTERKQKNSFLLGFAVLQILLAVSAKKNLTDVLYEWQASDMELLMQIRELPEERELYFLNSQSNNWILRAQYILQDTIHMAESLRDVPQDAVLLEQKGTDAPQRGYETILESEHLWIYYNSLTEDDTHR